MNQGFNRRNLIILFIVPVLFIITGVALLCAGSLDNMVAGISMLVLSSWLYLFLIVAFRYGGCTLSLKGNELVYRKGLNRVQRIALDEVEEIIYTNDVRGECVDLLLKNGTHIVAGVKEGLKLVRNVRKSVPVSAPSKTVEKLEKECLKSIKKRFFLIGKIFFLVLILVISLAVAIIATEGKEIDYFNKRDWLFFGVFMSIFVLCLFGLLALFPPLFRLIREVQGRIRAWRRGMIFEDIPMISDVQEVYTSINFDSRFSYKKEKINDVERIVVSIEYYVFEQKK